MEDEELCHKTNDNNRYKRGVECLEGGVRDSWGTSMAIETALGKQILRCCGSPYPLWPLSKKEEWKKKKADKHKEVVEEEKGKEWEGTVG